MELIFILLYIFGGFCTLVLMSVLLPEDNFGTLDEGFGLIILIGFIVWPFSLVFCLAILAWKFGQYLGAYLRQT